MLDEVGVAALLTVVVVLVVVAVLLLVVGVDEDEGADDVTGPVIEWHPVKIKNKDARHCVNAYQNYILQMLRYLHRHKAVLQLACLVCCSCLHSNSSAGMYRWYK